MIVVMFGYFMLIGKHSVDFSNTVLCHVKMHLALFLMLQKVLLQ